MSRVYWHKSIVNGKEVYRVWHNGVKRLETEIESEALALYHFLLAVRTKYFKAAIIEAFINGEGSAMTPEQYYKSGWEDAE